MKKSVKTAIKTGAAALLLALTCLACSCKKSESEKRYAERPSLEKTFPEEPSDKIAKPFPKEWATSDETAKRSPKERGASGEDEPHKTIRCHRPIIITLLPPRGIVPFLPPTDDANKNGNNTPKIPSEMKM